MANDKDQTDTSHDPFGEDAHGKDGRAGFVPEFVRKIAVAGLGALFMTEEGIRSLSGQLKIPKEVLGLILAQADKTKGDLGRVVSEEIRRFLQSERLRDELTKLVAGTTLEIKAQIRLVPSGKEAEDTAKVVVEELRARRTKRAKKE